MDKKRLEELLQEHIAEASKRAAACPCEQTELEPIYYVTCTNCQPVFVHTGSYHYGTTKLCGWKKQLHTTDEAEAEQIAAEWNAAQTSCPDCGCIGKFRAKTNFEICNDAQLLKKINYTALHTG